MYQRIFGGLSVTSKTPISRVIVTIHPFNALIDKLSTVGDGGLWTMDVTMGDGGASLEISSGRHQYFTLDEWTSLLSFPAYKLNTDQFLPYACPKFVDGQYHRTFSLFVEDIAGRRSAVVTRNLNVQTAVLVYSNEKPVIVSNAAASWKLDLQQSEYDPVRGNPSLTNFTAGMPWADLTSTTASLGK